MSNADVRRYRVFIASPGDVAEEVDIAKRVIRAVSTRLGTPGGFVLEPVRWETHAPLDSGRPQGLITPLLAEADVFLGILWSRFGTPTGVAESGTEEEFREALRLREDGKRPTMMVFFSEAAVPMERLRSTEGRQQFERTQMFRQDYQQSIGLAAAYADLQSFESQLSDHLNEWAAKRMRISSTGADTVAPTVSRGDEAAKTELTRLLNQYPLPRAVDVDPFQVLGVARSELSEHSVGERAPYIRRDIDDELDETLASSSSRLVIVVGPSRSGKSRTAYEAVLRNAPDHLLIIPRRHGDSSDLPSILEHFATIAAPETPAVLWLDDLHRFVDAGTLTLPFVQQIRAQHKRLVLVGTVRSGEYSRIRGDEGEVSRAARDLFESANTVDLQTTMSPAENMRAEELYSNQVFVEGSIGETFVAASRLKERFVYGGDDCPEGLAVMRAAIDWRRAGVQEPISEYCLRELFDTYFRKQRPVEDPTDEGFSRGLLWAREPLGRYVAMLLKEGQNEGRQRFSANDYLVEHVEGEGLPVESMMWELAIKEGADLTSVGFNALTRGLLEVARAAWARGLELDDGAAASNLGVLLEQQGNPDEAKKAYEKGMELGNGDAAFNLGVLFNEQGSSDEAKKAYEKGMELGSGDAAYNLGILLDAQGNSDEAKKAYEKGMELGSGDAAYNLGVLFNEQGSSDEAKKAYEKGMELGNGDAACNLGVLLNAQGSSDEARKAYEKGMELGSGDAASTLADILEEEGDTAGAMRALESAIAGFKQALAIDSNNAGALGDLGWSYYRLERYRESADASFAALEIDPEMLWVQCNLGLALLHLGRTDDARKSYNDAVTLARKQNDADGLKSNGLTDVKEALARKPDLPGGQEVLDHLARVLEQWQ